MQVLCFRGKSLNEKQRYIKLTKTIIPDLSKQELKDIKSKRGFSLKVSSIKPRY